MESRVTNQGVRPGLACGWEGWEDAPLTPPASA
jgi:hypothetical protein